MLEWKVEIKYKWKPDNLMYAGKEQKLPIK